MKQSRFAQAVPQLWSVLDPSARRTFALLICGGFVGAGLEIAAIVGLSTFVSMLVNPGFSRQSPTVRSFLGGFGVHDDLGFTTAVGVAVIGMLILSNATAGLNMWLNQRFTYQQERVLTGRLLEKYLSMPYLELIKINSAELLKNLMSGVATNCTLRPLIAGLVYAIVTVMLVSLVVVEDPVIALGLTGFVGICYAALSRYMKAHLGKLGEEVHLYLQRRYLVSHEALVGVKPVKVLGRERDFIARYVECTNEACSRMLRKGIFDFLPRYVLEVVTFGGIISIVLFQLWRGDTPESIFPALALYAFAGYRLIPAVHHVYSNWSEVQFHAAALSEFVEGLHQDVPELVETVTPMRFEHSIVLSDVTFAYVENEPPAVKNLSLEIKKGQSVGIVGPTGAGKSTLIDIFLGLLTPTSGELLVDGQRVERGNVRAWQTILGFVPQDIFLLDDTLERNIAFGLPDEKIDTAEVRKVAAVAQIDEFISELPEAYKTRVGERGVRLSGGQRQRVGIARAIYTDPQVVLLDEATSALDNITERSVVTAIRELAKTRTVITIAHRLTTVKDCDRIFVLSDGKLVEQGSYEELLANQGVFSELAARAAEPAASSVAL